MTIVGSVWTAHSKKPGVDHKYVTVVSPRDIEQGLSVTKFNKTLNANWIKEQMKTKHDRNFHLWILNRQALKMQRFWRRNKFQFKTNAFMARYFLLRRPKYAVYTFMHWNNILAILSSFSSSFSSRRFNMAIYFSSKVNLCAKHSMLKSINRVFWPPQ